ncbi:SBBP repeat-containing protein, partial [candidate division TA06 bacterium]|nr:SBBP repeat-containing protein [candidate division TA06 bacterium]
MLRITRSQFRKLLLICVVTVILLAGHWAEARVMEEWVLRYDGEGNVDDAKALTLDSFGNIFVTGRSWSDTSLSDYATIKYFDPGSGITEEKVESTLISSSFS